MNLNQRVGSKITVKIQGRDGSVRVANVTHNIMTQLGLNAWATGVLGVQLAIGTGARPESTNITGLQNYVRSAAGSMSAANVDVIDYENGVIRTDYRLTVQFPVETVPQNYSELGLHAGNVNQLRTYSLMVDSVGNPTTISVLEGERIIVDYAIQFNIPLLHQQVRNIAGVPTTVSVVPVRIGTGLGSRMPGTTRNMTYIYPAGQPIPTVAQVPAGGVTVGRTPTLINGIYSVYATENDYNLEGGISLLVAQGNTTQVGIMVHFNPPIPKTSANNMDIRISPNLSNGAFYES